MFGRQKIAMIVAEFLGAATLSVAVYTIIARTSFPLFSGIAAGSTIAVLTLVIGAASGAHFNPAVTFGLWTVKKIETTKAIVYIAAQLLGGLAAWALLKYFLGHNLTSIAGPFEWKIFVAEATGSALFVLGFTSAVLQKYEGGKIAATVGTALLMGILVASMASNAVLNPAVAIGIQSWSWTYAVAPLVGGLVGANLYALLFAGESVGLTSLASKATASTKTSTTKKTTTKKKK